MKPALSPDIADVVLRFRSVDIVVVTRARDAHLLRYFLASYECFWEGHGQLILFTRRSDSYLWESIRLPTTTRLVYREDFPELGSDDFRNQLYLKLVAHQFVETEYYIIMDSDFLFVAPCSENAFLYQGKPAWFRRAWDEVAARWREGSEAFVGASIDYLYMPATPQYVFARTVAAELCRSYDPRRILEMVNVSEFVVYGWFAQRFFGDTYHWVDRDSGAIEPVGQMVNQLPPSYCVLDPFVSLSNFPKVCYVVFWSHWDLAETKMAEFLYEAHQRHPDRPLHFPEGHRIYPLIRPPVSPETLYSELRGIYADGWVKDDVWFAVGEPVASRQLRIVFDVPSRPVTGTWQVSSERPNAFQFHVGLNELLIVLGPESKRYPVVLRFDATELAPPDSTGRSLRARLLSLGWYASPLLSPKI